MTALRFSDAQLAVLMTAAAPLPPDKRVVFLERLGALLAQIRCPADRDVALAAARALRGLDHARRSP
jgi:hypothetical protein